MTIIDEHTQPQEFQRMLAYIIQDLELSPIFEKLLSGGLMVAITLIFIWYGRIYTQVHHIWMEQESIIQTYKENPSGELWLPAYPAHSIHSGEAVTSYHQEVFLKYYGLPLEAFQLDLIVKKPFFQSHKIR